MGLEVSGFRFVESQRLKKRPQIYVREPVCGFSGAHKLTYKL